MFAKTLFASVLVVSSVVFGQQPLSADKIPECATKCMTTKVQEATNWFGPGNLATYCTHPEFLLAYDQCITDHCQGEELALGQQAGAAACGTTVSALNATHPAAGTGAGVDATPSANGTHPSSVNGTHPASANSNSTSAVHGPILTNATSTSNLTSTSGSAVNSSLTSSSRPGSSSTTVNNTATGASRTPSPATTSGTPAAAGASASSAGTIDASSALLAASVLAGSLSMLF